MSGNRKALVRADGSVASAVRAILAETNFERATDLLGTLEEACWQVRLEAGFFVDLLEGNGPRDPVDFRTQLREYERTHIATALAQARGDRAVAAESLRMPLSTLKRKCRQYGL